MKNILLAILTLLFVHYCIAQPCETSYFVKQGAVLETHDIDKNGQIRGKQIMKVKHVENTPDGIRSTITTTRLDAQGKVVDNTDTRYLCAPTGVKKYVGYEDTQTKTDAFLSYPFNLKPSDKIPGDVSYNFEQLNEQGKKTKGSTEIRNRYFEGMEDVTTPAGTFRCMKIRYDLKAKIKMGIVTIPVPIEATEWYSFEVGVVKMEGIINGTRETFIQLASVKQ